MKVLFVASANHNGITSLVQSQGESLLQHGVLVDYFGIEGKGLWGYLGNVSKLRKYIPESNPDIIHAHYSLSGMVAGLTVTGKPLVVSLMGSDTKSSIFWKFLIRLFATLFWNTVIVKSSSMKQDIGIREAIIIPNGVDLNIIKPILIDSLNSKKKTILFAADPERYVKNYRLAREAISLLEDDRIIFEVIHSKPHKEIIKEINNADVLVVTSRWEGSPNIIKEAMACNCPVVSTDVGDVRWLLGDTAGCYITSFKPEDVAEKLRLALEFSKRNGRTNGRLRIIELGLDSEIIASRIVEVYTGLIGK